MTPLSVCCLALHLTLVLSLQDKDYWLELGKRTLKDTLKIKHNTRVAKNIIFFISDGMGVNTLTAARIYAGGEGSAFTFEKFPHLAAIKTYATDKQVSDSAATGTALFSGVKTNYYTVGVDANVHLNNCIASLEPKNRVHSIMTWAQKAGKDTGIVTTTRITHATPAATYASSANRYWECENDIPQNSTQCKDIARQLVEDLPGKDFKVILGGGRQCLVSDSEDRPEDSVSRSSCTRKDGRNLINNWVTDKQKRNAKYLVANETSQLTNLKPESVDYLLGIFANNHLPYEHYRNKKEYGVPSLAQMTTTAIKILKKNTDGFVLMVEGGMIDQAHHIGKARLALDEVVQFNLAINQTMQLLEELKIKDDTLVIVTSDHSHSLSFNGYPPKGNDILGIASISNEDGVPYTTLTYGVGSLKNYQFSVDNNGRVVRQDPSLFDTRDYNFMQQAAAPNDQTVHGGGDVLLFASGPMAHLFHSVHEQNYIPLVAAYAAKIGYFQQPVSSVVGLEPSIKLFIAVQMFLLYQFKSN